MNQITRVQIPVEAETAAALTDARRMEAVGRLVDRMVRPAGDDPLAAVLDAAASEAAAGG